MQGIKRIYYFVTALSWFATVLPLSISVLFAQSRGFTLVEIGLFTGLHAFTVALLEVPTGGLADIVGRKRVTLLACALSIVATTLYLVAFTLPVLLAYALLNGAARALGSGALQAWFVDALQEVDPEVDLQPPLALAGTFELLALAAGTLVGGLLPTLFSGLPTGEASVFTPLATSLLASMLMKGAVIVIISLLVRETPGRGDRAGASNARPAGVAHVLREAFELAGSSPAVLILLGVEALGGFAYMGMEMFWQPFFGERMGRVGEQTWVLGVILAACFGVGMLGNLAAIPATRWFGRRYARVAALFKLVQVGALVLLARQQDVAAAAGLYWLVYFAMSTASSPLATQFNSEIPSSRRSVMLSMQSLAVFAGAFLGSLVLAFIAQRASIGAAWTVSGVLLGGSVLLLLWLDCMRGQDRPSDDAGP